MCGVCVVGVGVSAGCAVGLHFEDNATCAARRWRTQLRMAVSCATSRLVCVRMCVCVCVYVCVCVCVCACDCKAME